MMNSILRGRGLGTFLILLTSTQALDAAPPPCQGPNKNDPGCPGTEEAAAATAALVNSVTVNWLNNRIEVRGEGFVDTTEFRLGSSVTPLTKENVGPNHVDLPFNTTMATEVTSQGNYNLVVDGAVALSVYIEAQIVDPTATGCPCETEWSSELGSLWGVQETECFEILGPETNDIADISGTILSTAGDATAYPQYPIGASFYPGAPSDSYCALVQVNGDATTTERVHKAINEIQQVECADALKVQVCGSVTPLP